MRVISLGAAHAAHPVFEKMNWVYWDSGGKPPTVENLAETIDSLIDTVEDNGYEIGFKAGTGRFVVSVEDDGVGNPTVRIFLDLGEY